MPLTLFPPALLRRTASSSMPAITPNRSTAPSLVPSLAGKLRSYGYTSGTPYSCNVINLNQNTSLASGAAGDEHTEHTAALNQSVCGDTDPDACCMRFSSLVSQGILAARLSWYTVKSVVCQYTLKVTPDLDSKNLDGRERQMCHRPH